MKYWSGLLAFALLCPGNSTAAADRELPNIIYILCDDLGYGDVGLFNPSGKIPTPHMDRLGREGMVFVDAHSNSSVCTPTRYGVLTGRYAWRSRLKRGVLNGYSPHLIEEGRATVASLLKEHGYHTAFIGKWHLGWDWHYLEEDETEEGKKRRPIDFTKPISAGPREKGFVYSYGHSGSLDMPPYVYVENGMPTAVPDRVTGVSRKDSKNGWWRDGPTASDFDHWDVLPSFTRRAVSYVKEQAKTEQPFFLYLPLASPHTPVLPTEKFVGSSGVESAYADFATMTDDCIGQVVTAVEEMGIADNTLIIVTSDNGCSPQADFEELESQGHDPSYIYRGHKADIFEGGHRVPLIVRWPARVAAGSVSSETICLTDFMATCADIIGANLPVDAGEDSVSMLPVLTGDAAGPLRAATVHHSIQGSFAIRQGKWKLVDAPHSGGWSAPRPQDEERWENLPPVQLYDLEADPAETNNLQDAHPEVVARLTKLLTRYKSDKRSAPFH